MNQTKGFLRDVFSLRQLREAEQRALGERYPARYPFHRNLCVVIIAELYLAENICLKQR